MIHIQKEHPSPEVSREIQRVKRDNGWSSTNYGNHEQVRLIFDQLDKKIIRKQLLEEQKGLCAYCMRKLQEDDPQHEIVIEHWMPITSDGSKALDYSNMLACCDGGRSSTEIPRVLCCDAAKAGQQMKTSPCQREQMDKIRYDRDGYIRIYPEDQELSRDINQVLKLNGELDEKGRMISDTATRLVHGRRQVYVQYEQFIKGLIRSGKQVRPAVQKKLEEINGERPYREYVGVWQYLLKRKLREKAG